MLGPPHSTRFMHNLSTALSRLLKIVGLAVVRLVGRGSGWWAVLRFRSVSLGARSCCWRRGPGWRCRCHMTGQAWESRLAMRVRLNVAPASNVQIRLRARPTKRSLRQPPTVFFQPKISSTRLRVR